MTLVWTLSCDYTSSSSLLEALLGEALADREGVEVEVYYFRGFVSRFDCEEHGASELCPHLDLGPTGSEVKGRLVAAFAGSRSVWVFIVSTRRGSTAYFMEGGVAVRRGVGVELPGVRLEFTSPYSTGSGGGEWRRGELERSTFTPDDLESIGGIVDEALERLGLPRPEYRVVGVHGGALLSLGGPGLLVRPAGGGRLCVRREEYTGGAGEKRGAGAGEALAVASAEALAAG